MTKWPFVLNKGAKEIQVALQDCRHLSSTAVHWKPFNLIQPSTLRSQITNWSQNYSNKKSSSGTNCYLRAESVCELVRRPIFILFVWIQARRPESQQTGDQGQGRENSIIIIIPGGEEESDGQEQTLRIVVRQSWMWWDLTLQGLPTLPESRICCSMQFMQIVCSECIPLQSMLQFIGPRKNFPSTCST